MAMLQARARGLLPEIDASAIPKHDGAPAVLALGDRAFEGGIRERMIFHLNGKSLLALAQGQALRHGPGLQHAINGKSQIVMQVRGIVLLNHERARIAGAARRRRRFGRARKIPLLFVSPQFLHDRVTAVIWWTTISCALFEANSRPLLPPRGDDGDDWYRSERPGSALDRRRRPADECSTFDRPPACYP